MQRLRKKEGGYAMTAIEERAFSHLLDMMTRQAREIAQLEYIKERMIGAVLIPPETKHTGKIIPFCLN